MNATELKTKFQTGDIPTQTDFENLIDAISNKQNVINLYYEDTANSKEITYSLVLGNITSTITNLVNKKIPIEIIKIYKKNGTSSTKPMDVRRYSLNIKPNFIALSSSMQSIIENANFDTGVITIDSNSEIESLISTYYYLIPDVINYTLTNSSGNTSCITINTAIYKSSVDEQLMPIKISIINFSSSGTVATFSETTLNKRALLSEIVMGLYNLQNAIISNGDWETALETLKDAMNSA